MIWLLPALYVYTGQNILYGRLIEMEWKHFSHSNVICFLRGFVLLRLFLWKGKMEGGGEAICLRLILSLYINWLLASLYGRFSSDCVTFTHFDSTKHKYTITSSGKFKAIHPIHEISYRSSFGVPLFFAQLAFDCMWLDSLTIISFDK